MRNYWNLRGKQENPVGELEVRKRNSEICPASTCSSEEETIQTIIHHIPVLLRRGNRMKWE